MRLFKLLLIFSVCLAPVVANALSTPKSNKLDKRIRIARYVDGQVFKIRVASRRSTTIEFARGEKIIALVAGDTVGFKFQSVPGHRVFSIKPLSRTARTNVTVYTNKHTYYLEVITSKSAYYAVRFSYPKTKNKKSRNQLVKKQPANYNYGVSATNELTPVRIWDDGTFTYFQFRANSHIGSIFKVTRGQERSVNSSRVGTGIIRVSGTSKQWAIRLGNTEVCIVELV